jgi:hypothetical protein
MMNEAGTRKQLVEKALIWAGWSPIVDFKPGKPYVFGAVREYVISDGRANYILFVDGYAIAVVESKRLDFGPRMFWFRLSVILVVTKVDHLISTVFIFPLSIRAARFFGFKT